jgi:hypothetical protein
MVTSGEIIYTDWQKDYTHTLSVQAYSFGYS